MTTRDDARSNALRDPRGHHVVTNLCFNTYEIAGAHVQFRCMAWVDPKWIRVRDLIEPLCVRATRVNLHCETKSRDQNRLICFEIVFVNVALEVDRDG